MIRPLHDALVEDALDKAEGEATGSRAGLRAHSAWVRLLRPLARVEGD